jgi:hypothetical protein
MCAAKWFSIGPGPVELWVYGKTTVQMDVPIAAARELYNKNWDGCRDLWKELYRAKKHPGSAPAVRFSQNTMIGWFSGTYRP